MVDVAMPRNASVHLETDRCCTHQEISLTDEDLYKYFSENQKTLDTYLLLARAAGTQRLKFSDDLFENAHKAVSALWCQRCGEQLKNILLYIKRALTRRVRDLREHATAGTGIDPHLHSLLITEYGTWHKAFENYDKNFSLSLIPAASVVLKKLDHHFGGSSGCYTLFNRMSLRFKAAFNYVFSDRLNGWLFRDPETFKPEAISVVKPLMERVFSMIPAAPQFKLTFKEFLLNRDLWATAGAVDQKTPKTWVHTKAAFAYSMTDEQLWQWWLTHRDDQPIYDVFNKPDETAAFRLIVTTDLVTYIKIAYQNLVFEKALAQYSPIWSLKPNKEKLAAYSSIQDDMCYQAQALYCDGQNWDGGVYKEYLLQFYELKATKITNADPDAHLDTLIWQLDNVLVRLPDGSIKPQTHGLPSGSRDTTNFNSCLNSCMCLDIDDKSKFFVLGDDNLLIGENVTMARAALSYERFDMKLNVQKSGESRGYCEFLKTIITPFSLAGFPVRALRSILFSGASEVIKDTPVHMQRADLWSKFISRTRVRSPEYWCRWMVDDIMNATDVFSDRQACLEWLTSSRAYDGGGFWFRPIHWRVVQTESDGERQRVLGPRLLSPPDRYTLPRLWESGYKAKIIGMMRPNLKLPAPTILKILKDFNEVAIDPALIPPFFLTDAAVAVSAPVSSLHDAIEMSLDGCVAKKDYLALADGIADVAPNCSSAIFSAFHRYSGGLAIALIKGKGPSGFSPMIGMTLGDAYAELLAQPIRDFSIGLLSRHSTLQTLARYIDAVGRRFCR